ncbi:nitrile hydratase subunit beta [Sphingomonas sp. AR_OL41]|uniref:SH3-like domain-containing protein n=1 Tax=Sphingomonas sp. AR_OL41 TaxID=3042729 RepID=UPI00248094BF|nr:SH3-like domain-containing protein [Sphingomonas sp. AR_OL41]MDH7972839.1 nitrile hydratase subunit beta [Sphingomonas sp. AR_OL41]
MIESMFSRVVTATGETPLFAPGDRVSVGSRVPIGHYRVPTYLRGKAGQVIKVIEPSLIDNEEEGYGRNAGNRRHYYRISVMMTEIWADYEGSPRDELQIEVYETWLERLP